MAIKLAEGVYLSADSMNFILDIEIQKKKKKTPNERDNKYKRIYFSNIETMLVTVFKEMLKKSKALRGDEIKDVKFLLATIKKSLLIIKKIAPKVTINALEPQLRELNKRGKHNKRGKYIDE